MKITKLNNIPIGFKPTLEKVSEGLEKLYGPDVVAYCEYSPEPDGLGAVWVRVVLKEYKLNQDGLRDLDGDGVFVRAIYSDYHTLPAKEGRFVYPLECLFPILSREDASKAQNIMENIACSEDPTEIKVYGIFLQLMRAWDDNCIKAWTWQIASYDKITGEEVAAFPITDTLADHLRIHMGHTEYQDCYDITPEGFAFLSSKRYNLDPTKLDYQLEVER